MQNTDPRKIINTATGEINDLPDKMLRDRSKENSDFIMLYRRFISQVSDLGMADPQALRILLFLCRHMDTRNSLVVSMDLLGNMLHLSRQTISAKIKYLRDNGWIAIYKIGRQNVYVVNPEFVWTSYADQKQYCTFDSKVMLSYEDNWNITKQDKTTLKHIDRDVMRTLAEKEFPSDEIETSSQKEAI